MNEFLSFLEINPHIRVFRLNGNSNLKKDEIKKIISQQFPIWNLETLELKNQKIDIDLFSEILANLKNSKLRYLNLDSNLGLGDEAVSLLLQSKLISTLRCLSLGGPYNGCGLSENAILKLFTSSHKIRHLDISWNVQSDDINMEVKEINPNIFSLDISYCCLSDVFVEKISKYNNLKRLINKKNAIVEKVFEQIKEKYQF